MEQRDGCTALFESKAAKGCIPHRLYAVSVCAAVYCICIYRATHLPGQVGRWAWLGLSMAELWFILYWLVTQTVRWNPLLQRRTFKDRLPQRGLPGVDIFVCTADPAIEPPIMVINTVLSVMAYDYAPEKLGVYLSDDGGSQLTFYALLEASWFAKQWLPYCKKHRVEPRSPEAYFSTCAEPEAATPKAQDWLTLKNLYEEMKKRIDKATGLGEIPDEVRKEHKAFGEWDLVSSSRDHHTILKVLIDGRDSKHVDVEGQLLPTLVYLAREKRPHYHHNFKAGAMNALIRVSSRITNGPLILNVDCDMYSNNSESVRDALCFFMDERNGHRIAFVQSPQCFHNLTKNDVYGCALRVIYEVELPGLESHGGSLYIGSGCFHRRETLCGKIYNKECKTEWNMEIERTVEESVDVLEETCKVLASCSYEENTQWGKEMGLKYGCLVEDIITGLSIKCRGWKAIYFHPRRKAFLGLAPTTLLQSLAQHKRWSEGDFQIFLSKYCPLVYGHKKIPLKLQMAYCCYLLWAPNCLATLCYAVVPSLCMLRGISLFPKLSSPWALPFVYAFAARQGYSLAEFVLCGGTLRGWWNDQRMWLFRRLTSYLFAFTDSMLKLLGIAESGFVVTAKVADKEVARRYKQEVMEFGNPSPMLNILSTLALFNLFSLAGGLKKIIVDSPPDTSDQLALQILLCGLLVLVNLPVYEGLFLRRDKGSMPTSVTCQSLIVATFAYLVAMY